MLTSVDFSACLSDMQVAQQQRSPLLEVRRSQPTIQETFQSGAVELQLVLHIIGVVGWRV